jgi:Sec-independent protein translocase protein TatA
MFGMSLGEVFFIFVIAIIVLGPDKLPGAIKTIVKLFKQLKAQTGDIREVFNDLQNETDKITSGVNEHITSLGNMSDIGDIGNFDEIDNKIENKLKNGDKNKNKDSKQVKQNKKDINNSKIKKAHTKNKNKLKQKKEQNV